MKRMRRFMVVPCVLFGKSPSMSTKQVLSQERITYYATKRHILSRSSRAIRSLLEASGTGALSPRLHASRDRQQESRYISGTLDWCPDGKMEMYTTAGARYNHALLLSSNSLRMNVHDYDNRKSMVRVQCPTQILHPQAHSRRTECRRYLTRCLSEDSLSYRYLEK